MITLTLNANNGIRYMTVKHNELVHKLICVSTCLTPANLLMVGDMVAYDGRWATIAEIS